MTKPLLIAACGAFFATQALAQIPNGGFEDWTDFGTYEEPNGWFTSNTLLGGLAVNVERGTPGAVGAAHIKLTTVDLMGDPFFALAISTFPYNQRPAAFNGQIRYNIPMGDMGGGGVLLTRWNAGSQESEVIGVAEYFPNGFTDSWETFSIPFQYESALDPDSAFIILLSSDPDVAVVGSTVDFDDLSFGNFVSVQELVADDAELSIYPSPAVDVVRLSATQPLQEVQVWSMDGRLVLQHRATGPLAEVDVDGLASGMYTVRALRQDGRLLQGSFLKQ